MKKICFVTTISYALKAFVIDTAKYMHENGDYDITFICDNDIEFTKILPEYIHFIPVSMKRGISLRGIGAIFDLIRIFKDEKFDLVQYSTPNAAFYASIAAKYSAIPVRLYCQWGLVYVGFTGIKRKIFRGIEKFICSLSTWIEPDSFGNLNFCRNEGLYKGYKSSVVWNGSASGVNISKFDFTQKVEWRKDIRHKYNISDETFVIGFVGRITRDKGINELLAVCKTILDEKYNMEVLIIGSMDNPKILDQQLLEWALRETRIIFCGQTNEVEKYLSAMDVFVLPSYREGFGSVVIEAEAMGVPVIVTNIPGPIEAMESDRTGIIVEKNDTGDLLAAIKILYQNKELCLEMGGNGVQFAKDKFDQRVFFVKTLSDRDRLLE